MISLERRRIDQMRHAIVCTFEICVKKPVQGHTLVFMEITVFEREFKDGLSFIGGDEVTFWQFAIMLPSNGPEDEETSLFPGIIRLF